MYRLPQPIAVPTHPNPRFVPLPEPLTVTETTPILNNTFFTQRRRQMEERQPPQHPELEALQGAVTQLSDTNLAAKELDRDIRNFLGWTNERSIQHLDSDLIWIQTIAAVGNSSDGHAFEKLVRRSLIKLGFTNSNCNPKASLDPEATGGAGGIDVYCEEPYPIVGECKATKTESVKTETPSQLVYLGMKHLGKDQYDRCIKLIVAAGQLNQDALKIATENQMNVIRPETLQRLVELQAKYKGSIDLLALKRCLEVAPFGLADEKIEQYLAEVRRDVEVRSHLVRAVRQLGDLGSKHLTAEIRIQYNAIFAKEPKSKLQDLQQVHHLLVELSSPLTGYLGRERGSDWKSDRFYFLRELD